MSDDQLNAMWYYTVGSGDPTAGNAHLRFARAVLAAQPAPAVREPISDQKRGDLVMEHLGPLALTGGKLSIYDAFMLGIDAAQRAHGITGDSK